MQVKETTEQLAERAAELDAQREMLTTEDERLTGVLAEVKQGVQLIAIIPQQDALKVVVKGIWGEIVEGFLADSVTSSAW